MLRSKGLHLSVYTLILEVLEVGSSSQSEIFGHRSKDGRISTRKWQEGKLISCQEPSGASGHRNHWWVSLSFQFFNHIFDEFESNILWDLYGGLDGESKTKQRTKGGQHGLPSGGLDTRGTNISHPWKRKFIKPATFEGDVLVPWSVLLKPMFFLDSFFLPKNTSGVWLAQEGLSTNHDAHAGA